MDQARLAGGNTSAVGLAFALALALAVQGDRKLAYLAVVEIEIETD